MFAHINQLHYWETFYQYLLKAKFIWFTPNTKHRYGVHIDAKNVQSIATKCKITTSSATAARCFLEVLYGLAVPKISKIL